MPRSANDLIVIPESFWQRPQVCEALRNRDMGRFFLLVQQYTGASQTQIGIAIGWSQGKVSDVERGASEVKHLAVFEQIADGLKVPNAARVILGLAAMPDSRAARVDTGQPSPQENAVPDPIHSSFEGDMVEAVKRREFLLGMATSVGFSTVGGMAPTFRHVDPELISYFQQQLEGHYRADMLLGPRALINTVTAQCNLIGQLMDNADEPTRQRMAVVGTSFSTFAAWLYLDTGDIAAALYWHDTAQEMAHRSRDREAIACALVDRAMARTDQGIGAAVVDLCNGALVDAGHLSPEIRVFALQQQAHGASLLGDRRQADTLLDAAGELIDQVDVEVWGTACLRTPHYVEVQRATCYGRLGLAREALGVWQQVIPAAPSNARRDVGVWMARQATLSASLREPERTVELARHAVKVALETGSARVRRELATTEITMTPWQAEPVGQDFAEALAPISEGV
jgi:dienelactone hydrolase